MIRQGAGELDFAAVAADAALLDLLSSRAPVPVDDPVARMLAAFAAEVDDGLAELLAPDPVEIAVPAAVPDLSVVPALPPVSGRRSHGLRATTIALVVGATLSVSGVAAAVTGDPFAAYHGIVSAVTGDGESAAQAARVAWLQRQLAGTRAKVAHGDLAGAGADLTAMRAALAGTDGLSHGQRTALEARISALESALARAAVTQQQGKGNSRPAADPSSTPGPQGATSHEPHGGGVGQPDSTGTAQPDKTKAAQPQNTKAPQPQNTKAPQPQNTQVPQPQNTKEAEPAPTVTPDPRTPGPQTTRAHPQTTRTAQPQNTKIADSQLSPAAQPPGTEQPGNGSSYSDRNGSSNGNGHA